MWILYLKCALIFSIDQSNMQTHKLFVICFLVEFTLAHYPVLFSVHKSLQTYLEDVCSKTHSGKYLIVVSNLITKNYSRENLSLENFQPKESNLKYSKILNFFKKRFNCPHTFYFNITSYYLLNNLPHISKYYHRQQIVLIFEFTQFSHQYLPKDEHQHYHSILHTLSYIYSKCLACAPLLVQFSHLPLAKIFAFSKLLFDKISTDFQAIIFSLKIANNKNNAVYFRPTLNGCRVENSVIMPREDTSEMKAVQTPFQRCDFNFTTFKIVVNHVSASFTNF